MDKLFGAKVSIHRLGNSIWSMKDVVCNESGKTSVSEHKFFFFFFFLFSVCERTLQIKENELL